VPDPRSPNADRLSRRQAIATRHQTLCCRLGRRLPPPVRGDAALPIIVAYTVPKGAVVLFQPLIVDSRSLSVPIVEVLKVVVVVVVMMDVAIIRLPVAPNPLPGGGYRGAGAGRLTEVHSLRNRRPLAPP